MSHQKEPPRRRTTAPTTASPQSPQSATASNTKPALCTMRVEQGLPADSMPSRYICLLQRVLRPLRYESSENADSLRFGFPMLEWNARTPTAPAHKSLVPKSGRLVLPNRRSQRASNSSHTRSLQHSKGQQHDIAKKRPTVRKAWEASGLHSLKGCSMKACPSSCPSGRRNLAGSRMTTSR